MTNRVAIAQFYNHGIVNIFEAAAPASVFETTAVPSPFATPSASTSTTRVRQSDSRRLSVGTPPHPRARLSSILPPTNLFEKLRQWTGHSQCALLYDSAVHELAPRELARRLAGAPSLAVLVMGAGMVFGSFHSAGLQQHAAAPAADAAHFVFVTCPSGLVSRFTTAHGSGVSIDPATPSVALAVPRAFRVLSDGTACFDPLFLSTYETTAFLAPAIPREAFALSRLVVLQWFGAWDH